MFVYRELKMAFERTGEEGCVDPSNLKFRDKLALIGAAPGLVPGFGKPRKGQEVSSSEEEDEDQEFSLRKRRRMKKKRRSYFQRMSGAESAPDDAFNVSPSEASSPGTSGFPTSSSGVCSKILSEIYKIYKACLLPSLRSYCNFLHVCTKISFSQHGIYSLSFLRTAISRMQAQHLFFTRD